MKAGNRDKDTLTVGELLGDIRAAQQRMSVKNPHRRLLAQCAVAIAHLSAVAPDTEQVTRGGIVLPAGRIVFP